MGRQYTRHVADTIAAERGDGVSHRIMAPLLFFLFLCMLASFPAFAQAAGVEGSGPKARGVRAGGVIFWPALFLEGRYDTNVFRENSVEGETSAPALRIRPGLSFSNKKKRLYLARFGMLGDFRIYMSDNENVKAQGRYGGEAQGSIDFFPRSVLKVGVFDNFSRHLESPTVSSPRTMDGIDNTVGLRLSIRPGGTELRKPLSFTVGYANQIKMYDTYERGNTSEHRGFFKFVWLFLPKTSIVFDGSIAYLGYQEAGIDAPGPKLVNAAPVRVMGGIDGLITRKIAVVLKGGYGMSGHDEGETYDGYLAQTTIVYSPASNMVVSTGWIKNFQNSLFGNYFSTTEYKVQTDFRFMQRVELTANGSYSEADYGSYKPNELEELVRVSTTNRADQILRGAMLLNFDIFRFVGVTLGYNLEQVASDYILTPLKTELVSDGLGGDGTIAKLVDSGGTIITSCEPDTGLCQNAVELTADRDFGSFIRHVVFASLNIRY